MRKSFIKKISLWSKKEKQGTTIDTDALGKAVEQALKEGEETLNVEQANGYVKPAVTKDSELLAKQKKQLNELANVQVTYELPEEEVSEWKYGKKMAES